MMQILSLDLAKPGLEIPRLGASVPLKSSLLSVEWGAFGIAAKKSEVQHPSIEHKQYTSIVLFAEIRKNLDN
jgi:hypothetical protein